MPAATIENIRATKIALNRLGYYRPDSAMGVNADADENFTDALYAFQRKSALYFDDNDIGDGSTTQRILNEELARQPGDAAYIWRTVGDGKVRGEHASRAGKTFIFDNPPDGENPGEDYNCRCWAEPINPPKHPWIDWVNERRQKRIAQSSTVEKLAPPIGLNIKFIRQESQIVEKESEIALEDIITITSALVIIRLGGKVALPILLRLFRSGIASLRKGRKVPADDKIFKRPDGIPDEWISSITDKGNGIIFRPLNDPRTYVKIQKAKPNSPMLGQRYDNVRWMKDGKSLDAKGNIVIMQSEESHIPIEKFKFILEKFK